MVSFFSKEVFFLTEAYKYIALIVSRNSQREKLSQTMFFSSFLQLNFIIFTTQPPTLDHYIAKEKHTIYATTYINTSFGVEEQQLYPRIVWGISIYTFI